MVEHRTLSRSCAALLVACLVGISTMANESLAADGLLQTDEDTLQKRLETGLMVQRPIETRFIEKAIKLVAAGTLPRSIVESTYLWAIRRHGNNPFPYFKKGLRIRAAKIGVTL